MPPAKDEWVGAAQASAILRVSLNRVYVLARSGQIRAVQTFDAGRPRWKVSVASLMEWQGNKNR